MNNNNEILNKNQSSRKECEVWSRVMGYHRPKSQYNKGKAQEAKERVCFKVESDTFCKCETAA